MMKISGMHLIKVSVCLSLLAGICSLAAAEATKVYRVTVQASDAEKYVRSEQISTKGTHAALSAAISECDADRQIAQITTKCEPVSVDGEAITTAAELREQAGATLGGNAGASDAETATGKAAADRLSLFRIETPKTKLYLFGSVHLMKKNAYPLDPRIMSAFAESDKLVLEVDMGAIAPAELQRQFISRGVYPQGQSLSSELSDETVELIHEVLSNRGQDFRLFQSMRPWLLEQNLVTQEMQLYGFDPNAGIDQYFDERARAQGKSILQLETLEQQLNLLSTTSIEDQEFSLRYTLQALQERRVQQELNALVIDWLQGDVDGLFNYMMQPVEEFPQLSRFMTAMFDERNHAMVDKIDAWLKEGGRYFVIMGAGHLGGANGVVNLLRTKGYTLTQLERQS